MGIFNNSLIPAFGKLAVGDIDSERVQSFLNRLVGKASPMTVKNVWTTLRIMWNSAVAWKYVTGELRVELPRSRKLRMRCYTVQEVKRILANTKGGDQLFFWLAAETGMRVGEIVALRASDVDVEKKCGSTREGWARVSSIRVFIVDDFELFRQFVCAELAKRPDLQIVGEASDGLEAVQKAAELKPDLILMDIGLPTLNGLEATRQIRKLVPETKIIFLSQESSPEVMQEALSLGVGDYVVKARAGSELLAAVDAVILGKRFFSST